LGPDFEAEISQQLVVQYVDLAVALADGENSRCAEQPGSQLLDDSLEDE
jgi:hypothetical protein